MSGIMHKKIPFALIGCGAAGKVHAQAMVRSAAVELRLVIDSNEKAARSLGEQCGVPWTTDFRRALDDSAIKAVSVALPHHLHLEIAVQAAQASKHIMLEKPFTLSVSQATELVRCCGEHGVVIVPWLERRYLPYVEKAREILLGGTLGKVVYTRICCLGYKPRAYWEYGMRFEEYPSSWRGRWATSGGGVLLMNGIHQIDLMAFITGLEVEEVFARTATLHHEVEVEDMALVSLRYSGGAMGVIEASCCAYGFGEFPMERLADAILGENGHLQLGAVLKSYDRICHARTFEFPKYTVMEMKVQALEDFARHLREGTPMRTHADDAIRVLSVIEAAYRASKAGTPVRRCCPPAPG